MQSPSNYPIAVDRSLVGSYPASAKTGGGYVWDDVLEYRVWCYPRAGAENAENGNDYFYAFATYSEAFEYSDKTKGAQLPLALILQKEYIDEAEPQQYAHVKARRIAEWPVEFLARPRRCDSTIPDFLSPNAPDNRLDILRGIALSKSGS